MSFTFQDSTVEGNAGADHVLEVNVMKAINANIDYLDKAYTWVANAALQLYNGGWVPNILIRKVTTDHVFDNCGNYITQGNTWLNENGLGGGTYCWIVNCDVAFAAAGTGAWNQRRQAFSGTKRGGPQSVACTAVMESLHPYINNNCAEAQKLMGDVSSSNDHSLGKQRSDRKRTPMLGGYGKEEATAGDCSNWELFDGEFTNSLTSCTLEAVSHSYDHAEGNH